MPVKITSCRELKLTFDDAAQDGIAISCKAGIKVLDRHCIEGDSYGKTCGYYGEGIALTLGEMRKRLGLDPRSGEPAEMKCQICDKGEVVETEETDHKTTVLGQEMTIPKALVGRCDTCRAVNYAFRKP